MKNKTTSNASQTASGLPRTLGTWQVMVAGVALVVAASTLVTDFNGFFTLGGAFVIALGLGFLINLLLAIAAADLSASHPQAGALYHYARKIFPNEAGKFLGVFLGLAFYGMFAFAIAGETTAGALALQALTGWDAPTGLFIVLLGIAAVIPNLIGIRATAWLSAALLILMLGIRWTFGIAGFLGASQTGSWSLANLESGVGALEWFGTEGIISVGLALAFWSFVGIEFACSLAEETRSPSKSLPRGLIWGLVTILATTLVMGLGVTGTQPLSAWQQSSAGSLGSNGDAPQLAVGQLMFGRAGYLLMALASVAATLGSLTIGYAAMPRIIFGIARDGHFPKAIGAPLAHVHPRFGTPIVAILVTFALHQLPALYSSKVIDWLYSAAYAWIILYLVFHTLAIFNRALHPQIEGAFPKRWLIIASSLGAVLTAFGLFFAFAGSHAQFGLRALAIFAASLALTCLSYLRRGASKRSTSLPPTATTETALPPAIDQSKT